MNTRSLLIRYLVYRGLIAGSTLSLPNMIELYKACGLTLSDLCLLAASVSLSAVLLMLACSFLAAHMRRKDAVVAGLSLLACGQLGYVLSEGFLGLLFTECLNVAGFSLYNLADIDLVYATFGTQAKNARSTAGFVFHFSVAALAVMPMYATEAQLVYMPFAAVAALALAALAVIGMPDTDSRTDTNESFRAHVSSMLSQGKEAFLLNRELGRKLLFSGMVFTLLRPAQFMILPFLGECRLEPTHIAVYITAVNLLSALFMGLHPIIAARIKSALIYHILVGTIAASCLLLGLHPSMQGAMFLVPLIWAQVYADIELNNALNGSAESEARLSLNVLLVSLWRLGSAKALLILALMLQHGAPSGAYRYIGGTALLLGVTLATSRKQAV